MPRPRPIAAARSTLAWLVKREPAPLVAALLAAGAVWAFIEIADEVVEGESLRIDKAILRSMRSADDPATPIGPPWLARAAAEITSLGGTPVLILLILAVLGYLLMERKRRAALFVFVATVGAMLLSTALKYAFGRERPDVVPYLTGFSHPSFPSGHAMISAAVYLTLAALLARTQTRRRTRIYILAAALVITLLIGLTRIYLGVHYPTDVLAGWTAGAAWAIACWLAARFLQHRGMVEQPTEPTPG